MKYKKNIDTKLRHYSTSSSSTSRDVPITTSMTSVTDKLAKLRTEQARAATNRRQKEHIGGSPYELQQTTYHPWPGFFFTDEQQTDQPPIQASRSAAGPPPPPSWTTRRRPPRHRPIPIQHLSFRRYRIQQEKCTETTTSTIPSLARICCLQLARDHIASLSSRWTDQIKTSPNHIKQQLLLEWSFYDGCRPLVTNATMDMFEKTEYEELWLEASQISLERLIRAFWKINKVSTMDKEPVDDWEDLLSTGETLENDISTTGPTVVMHLHSQEEIGKWKYLSQVMAVLLQRQHHLLESSAMTNPSYVLSSPFLGTTLVSLNISFMRPAPSSVPLCWTSFAYLVVTTLPHLQWLYSAGCFESLEGPEILTVLSRGLRKLKFWDLGYHPWLQLDTLTSAIDWQHDLNELTTLCLSRSNNTSTDIATWFKNHQLAKIKFIWMDI